VFRSVHKLFKKQQLISLWMALSLGPITFGNPAGLIWLSVLIPLIILYLIRPRPKTLNIPSVMFFIQSSGAKKLTSFLRHLTKDWLFLIQLIILLALALTFAEPHHKYQHDVTAQNTVIVLDVSASSQVYEGSQTRFDKSIAQAKKVLGSKNTIVLAKDVPLIALRETSYDQARNFLDKLTPKQTTSRIGEAIILAGETLQEGRVAVISDFINTDGQQPEVAKAILESRGLIVDFITVAEKTRKNIGIVEIDTSNEQTTVYVKNYNQEPQNVNLKVGGTNKQLEIPALGAESFTFKTPAGLTKIELGVKDDFAIDNVAYLSAPQAGKTKILLIQNNATSFMEQALKASGDFEVTVAEPPVIPKGKFDIYVIHGVNRRILLPGTFEDIKKKLEAGATVIVHVQDDSDKIDYKGILPVIIKERTDGGRVSIDQLTRFTKNIELGNTNYVFTVEQKSSQTVIASVNDQPVLTSQTRGAGKVIYFGIPESSDFKYLPSYPIFWTELIKDSTENQDVRNLNFAAGDILLLDHEQKIKTPTGTVKKTTLVLDETGVYELEDRIIAVNLVNDRESDINSRTQVGTRSTEYELRPVKETREFPWDYALLTIALLFVLFEVWFVRKRGDV